MLEGLQEKFEDERNTLEVEEMKAKQGFEVMMLDLKNSVSVPTTTTYLKTSNARGYVIGFVAVK